MLCKEPLYVPIFGNIVGNAGPSLAQVLEHHNFLRGIRQKFFFSRKVKEIFALELLKS